MNKSEKTHKYYRKCSNNFAADCKSTQSTMKLLNDFVIHNHFNRVLSSVKETIFQKRTIRRVSSLVINSVHVKSVVQSIVKLFEHLR